MRMGTNLVSVISETDLSARQKTELLIELSAKQKTIVNGGLAMMKHPKLSFDDFNHALVLFNRVKKMIERRQIKDQIDLGYYLGPVEVALQKQINVIQMMSDVDLSKEQKSLCLYSLQNMILGLGFMGLQQGVNNSYVPRLAQDQYQMLIKGHNQGWDWDTLNDSCYSHQYRDLSNPVLADFNFLDLHLIEKNNKMIAQNQSPALTQKVKDQPNPNTITPNARVKTWGMLDFERATDVEINKILNQALIMFDKSNLQNNLPALFNFVKDSVISQSKDIDAVDYGVLHEIVVAAMHRIVEIGSEQQRKLVEQQQNAEGRSL